MPTYNCTNCGVEEIFLCETPSAHLIPHISRERKAGKNTQDLLKALEPLTTPDELAQV
jgi:hypothetical protein